mgnify:CR=1 FL=1
MVLHGADQHLVARLEEEGFSGTEGHEVDRLCRPSGEDEPFGGRGADEVGDAPSGSFVMLCSKLAQVVDAPMDVGIRFVVGGFDGLDDTAGLLGRRSVVQIDQGLAIDLLAKYGKFVSYRF